MPQTMLIEPEFVVVDEFVERGENPAGLPYGHYEIPGPVDVREYAEVSTIASGHDFHVLLRDNRVVKVRGAGLRYLPNPSNPADCGSYAILPLLGPKDVFVAVFRASEVTGIFTGELEAARADGADSKDAP